MVRPLRPLRAFCFTAPVFVMALLSASPVGAQDLASDVQAPAHISLVDGVAVLERDGTVDEAPANMPLLAGDRIRTRGGRVEILFADGSTLHLDHNSTVDLQSDDLVRLIDGRIRLSIPGPPRAVAYRVDGPHGWAAISEPGEYRVAVLNAPGGGELELAVIRGRAELANDGGRTPLRAGERAFVRAAAAPSYAFVLNSAAWDAFDRWSEARRDERLGRSAQYLPEEVRPYAAALDRHGYWRDEPTYGRVWYPRVQADWRPYYRGRWTNLRPYGWTWIAHDPWGWPTHHYGRWGFASSGWFWIPGRTWGAAWVSWASAPGYVSWCPLGWDNRPVVQINVHVGRGYDPWHAWTVVPQRHFGRGYVHRTVVRVDRLDHRTRGAFRTARRAPLPQGYAVPRASTPVRVAGTGAAGRSSAPLYTNRPPGRDRVRTDGARVRVRNGTAASAGERPSPGVARERTVPARPLVRSERPTAASPSSGSARPRSDGMRTDPWAGAAARTPQPRLGSAEPRLPRYTPSPERGRPAIGREGAPAYSAPPRGGSPVIERAPTGARPAPREMPRYGGGPARPSPGAPVRQAEPRTDPRPSSLPMPRPPQVERRGPDRAPSGSQERRGPAAAQPPAPSGAGGRPTAAPAGARPRPSGGGSPAAPAGARPRPSGGGH